MTQEEYIDKYKDEAIATQRKYGIPASITLAQALIESRNGTSTVALTANNHFGVTASSNWLKIAGHEATDPRQDGTVKNRFRKYDSVQESYDDHAKVLQQSNYKACFNYDPENYRAWATEIKRGGYATAPNYVDSLCSVIETYNLNDYTKQAKAMGPMGYNEQVHADNQAKKTENYYTKAPGHYAFPIRQNNGTSATMLVTSGFGLRTPPCERASRNHKGMDISASTGTKLFATEDNGIVTRAVNTLGNKGGRYVTVEYPRPDGSRWAVTYMHCSTINVKVGDKVNANTLVAKSGHTGNSSGPHLHLQTELIPAGVAERSSQYAVDPSKYLAEIAIRGQVSTDAKVLDKHTGKDYIAALTKNPALLQQYGEEPNQQMQQQVAAQSQRSEDPMELDDYMEKLAYADQQNRKEGDDPIMNFLMQVLEIMIPMAILSDQMEKNDAYDVIADTILGRKIDLSNFSDKLQGVTLDLSDKNNPAFTRTSGDATSRYALSQTQLDGIMNAINNDKVDAGTRAKTFENIAATLTGIMNNPANSIDNILNQKQNNTEQNRAY